MTLNSHMHMHRQTLLAGTCLIAAATALVFGPAFAQEQIETVTVTGSRIIMNGNDAPTPVTVMSVADLQVNTPSTVPDALQKLPVFLGSRSPRTTGGANNNTAATVLSLRNFGSTRTLILFNGNRVAPTSATGETDVNTLPQDLMERVDVVTGGASAVYGTDAVTGVVNFVVNSKFNGFKANVQGGISQYGDDASWKVSLVAGTDLFGGRGHIEASFNHFNSDGISTMMTRPYGPLMYTMPGNGKANNPYRLVANTRLPNYTPGGYISSSVLANQYFCSNGVLCPFSHGAATGTANDEIGGDGGYGGEALPGVNANPWLVASLKTNQAFTRFDYDLTNSIHTYAQISMTRAANFNVTFPNNYVMSYTADNAYLPAAAKTALANAGQASFVMGRSIQNQVGGISAGYTQGLSFTMGAEGTLFDDYKWDFHYTHAKNTLNERSPSNIDYQKLYAASDAVIAPNGSAVCRVSLGANAGLYPGCIPLDAFGPTATTNSAFRYVTEDTSWKARNKMDDIGANISGTVAELWAGPMKAALSAEWHRQSLEDISNYNPVRMVDCSTLNPLICDPNKARFNNVLAPLKEVSQDITEAAVEVDVPLVKNLPFAQEVDFNGAFRYARYSVSGQALTWKLGLVWNVTDELLFRGAQSRDIRAPTLNDMFAPVAANVAGFSDYLTGTTGNVMNQRMGNKNLVPEVAETVTAGFVYRPSWLSGFSVSADWYEIIIHNAITSVNGGTASAQSQCLATAPAYNSPFCAMMIRPHGWDDTTPGNYPSIVIYRSMNVSKTSTHGVDMEFNYATELNNISSYLDGSLTSRLLISYQPAIFSQSIPGATIMNAAGTAGNVGAGGAAKRVTFIAAYALDPITVNVMERWHSAERQNADPTLYFASPNVPSIAYTDLNVAYKFKLRDRDTDKNTELFLSVENLFNQQPHLWISTANSASQGYAYPAPSDEDVIGRYFTMGIRYKI
jgi:iron complex outermembrane recepter protein